MKISGGKFRGKNIFMPEGIRPTQNIVRKALFDIIGHDLEGIEFLELFAGSGAVGIDAISRNAKKVTFVEKERKCVDTIGQNIGMLALTPDIDYDSPYEVLHIDAYVAIKRFFEQKRTFDVVFVDPPYSRGLAKKALKTLVDYDILQPNSLVIIQHDKQEILPNELGSFLLFRKKKYGASFLSIYNINM